MTRPELYLELYGNGLFIWFGVLCGFMIRKKKTFGEALFLIGLGTLLWPIMVAIFTFNQIEECV